MINLKISGARARITDEEKEKIYEPLLMRPQGPKRVYARAKSMMREHRRNKG